MKPVHIDFAPRSLQRAVMRTPFFSWIVLLIALTLWISIGVKAINLTHQKNVVEINLEKVLQQTQSQLTEQNARAASAKKPVMAEAEIKAINGAIEQLNLPWRDLFDAIEAATPTTIALLSIEPEAKKHLVKGVAEAKNSDGMLGYIELLKREPLFSSVLLTKHEVNEQDPNKPLRFQFEAQWERTR